MTACPFHYQGQYEDAETGLYYNRFRYYDPENGQYLSQDPIGLLGGLGLYAYVKDPSGWLDVFGLSGCPKRDVDAIARKHGGTKLPDGRYQMPNRKAAKQAASEISGDLGSQPTTIRRKDYRDEANTHAQMRSNRVIGKHSADKQAGYHDHEIGHNFDRRPHFNAWSASTGTSPGKIFTCTTKV